MNWIEVQAKEVSKGFWVKEWDFFKFLQSLREKLFESEKQIENEYNTKLSYSRDQFIGADDDDSICYFQQ